MARGGPRLSFAITSTGATRSRLGETDLVFSELLPENPGWLDQDEYEERTSVGFHLGRLVKSVGQLPSAASAIAGRHDVGEE